MNRSETQPLLFRVLRGQWQYTLLRAEYQTAREQAEQLLHLAQASQNEAFLLEAHRVSGSTLSATGELAAARNHLEQGSALYNAEQHHTHAFLYGQDPGVTCDALVIRVLWLLGYPDQALKRKQSVLTLAQELAHPFSSAFALNFATFFHLFLHEVERTRESLEPFLSLVKEQGFVFWLAWGSIFEGWVLSEQGQAEAGIQKIRQGLAAAQGIESMLYRSYFLMLLAVAYRKAGQAEKALNTITEAMEFLDETGEREGEAELWRIKGELMLELFKARPEQSRRIQGSKPALSPSALLRIDSVGGVNGEEEAEECFQQALNVARRQQAKSWELRAATSLARLWQQQGKQAEARPMLAEVYNWFTEGFDTKDLQEAKALLGELE